MHNLTREELIRRITIIQEDVNRLYDLLGLMNIDTSDTSIKNGVSVDTYVTNVAVVCDMDKDGNVDEEGRRIETEWLTTEERNERTWNERKKPYDKIVDALKELDVDGEMMQYIIERVGMNDQMLRQLILTNPQSDTVDLLNEHIELSDKGEEGVKFPPMYD